jgi:hypothetical protein
LQAQVKSPLVLVLVHVALASQSSTPATHASTSEQARPSPA